MTSDNGDVLISWVGVLDLRDESGSTDNIEGGDTEETFWVVDSLCLEDLGNNWDRAVYWVGNDEDVGFWGRLGSGFGKIADDGCICVEKIVTGHARFARNTSGDEDNLCALEGRGETGWCWVITGNCALGVDVGDIGGDTWMGVLVGIRVRLREGIVPTWASADIVYCRRIISNVILADWEMGNGKWDMRTCQLGDSWVKLEEEGQWLSTT